MRVYTFPDPVLHEICEPVEVGDKAMARHAKSMLKQMYKSDGVGLAGPQVGLLKRIVVIDTDYVTEDEDGNLLPSRSLVLINPEIVDHSEEQIPSKEGCISLPGLSVDVKRWEWVKVKCLDADYNEVEHVGDGLFGVCMQHEIDHLDGMTLIERADPIARLKALREYQSANGQ